MPYQPITEQQAREIVRLRVNEAKDNERLTPVRLFAEKLKDLGVTDRLYSVPTITNILNGKTFPELKDSEGHPIIWTSVPTRQRGRGSVMEGKSIPGRVRTLELAVLALQQKCGVVP